MPEHTPQATPQNHMTNSAFNPADDLPSQNMGELLRAEIERWAEATTRTHGDRDTRLFEKVAAVTRFFSVVGRFPHDVRPPDVRIWCDALEAGGHNASTVRDYVGFLSSFFEWLIKASVPGLLASQNPTKAVPKRPAKAPSAEDWEEKAEALVRRVRSVRVGNTLNLRDFSAADLDELEELLGYRRRQLASLEIPADIAACEDLIVTLREFGLRLKKFRIMYMVVAMRAVSEINRKQGEQGNWDMIIEEVRKARPSWNIPASDNFTLQWLDKLDALLIESLNRRFTHAPRTRLASSPIAREGFIRFPSERIFKSTLEALMPGAMLAGPALSAALETRSDRGGRADDSLEVAYVFKSKRGDFEGTIGLPYGTDSTLRHVIQDMPSLAVKALFALWARLYTEPGNPAFGESITVSVSQFCDDLGYKRKGGAHEPENRRHAVLVLRALMALDARITYKLGKRQVLLDGPIFHHSPLSSHIQGYSDLFPLCRASEIEDVRGAEAFTYGPGAVYRDPTWRARNTSVALAGEGLLKLGSGNKDKWPVLIGGYIASVAGMNNYRQRPVSTPTLLEKTGLSRDRKRHRQVGRMQDKLEAALDRLREVSLVAGWEPITSGAEEWLIEKVEIVWPDVLGKRADERKRSRERHKRSARRGRAAGSRAKHVE
jgi:hypothetical protein